MTIGAAENYDRSKEVKDFDDSKIGVKGLVDSGITSIPRFFVHSPESLPSNQPHISDDDDGIPIIDLSSVNSHRRSIIVDQIKEASRTWGFFQIINHDIPLDVLDRTICSIKAFNEQPTEIKSKYYTREMGKGVSFLTNIDLFQSKAASWRDTLQVRLGPTYPDLDQIPEICRNELVEWDQHVQRLGEILMGVLCEGMGLETDRLKEMTCLEGRTLASHYYPYCPEPDRTVGLSSHSDPGVLTVLLQDKIGGLFVRKNGGEDWVEVKPLAGAIVINIGDLLQIISNDEYKSAEHRVVANRFQEPRVSAAVFFNPGKREDIYGPVPELISPEKPALYKQFTLSEFLRRFFTKGLDGKSLIDYFKL
ncbi:Oxoglutarate/iron-dependent dioxygenase [Macleaya cordata]|uniref:Oxoglutarate/iron-dependent dioxygenase n=1 Tax=Macleaya cordata TaxID=56857 RepID=A0A200PMD9_MACCD|nr:Oxoglutarate/iron-dependent dioxygenase [Macleaya cordata]